MEHHLSVGRTELQWTDSGTVNEKENSKSSKKKKHIPAIGGGSGLVMISNRDTMTKILMRWAKGRAVCGMDLKLQLKYSSH